jgi:hypothetical protein
LNYFFFAAFFAGFFAAFFAAFFTAIVLPPFGTFFSREGRVLGFRQAAPSSWSSYSRCPIYSGAYANAVNRNLLDNPKILRTGEPTVNAGECGGGPRPKFAPAKFLPGREKRKRVLRLSFANARAEMRGLERFQRAYTS